MSPYPPTLFHQARSGDLNALCHLLRLDKSVLADPFIAEIWHRAAHSNNRAAFRKLSAAVRGHPSGEISRRRVRLWLSGIISQLAASMNYRMEEKDIQKLFKMVAEAKLSRSSAADVFAAGESPDSGL